MGEKMMIWGRVNSINVMKVLWAAGELGLSYDRVDTGNEFGYAHVPDYIRMNPNRKIPTLRDGEIVLWESNVIVRYLAETYGRGILWPESTVLRWEAEKWMDWQQTALGKTLNIILYETVRKPPAERDLAAAEASRLELIDIWEVLEAHMTGRSYILGDIFSMADIPLGCAVYRWYAYQIERPASPNIEAWYERLQERPAFREHVMLPLS